MVGVQTPDQQDQVVRWGAKDSHEWPREYSNLQLENKVESSYLRYQGPPSLWRPLPLPISGIGPALDSRDTRGSNKWSGDLGIGLVTVEQPSWGGGPLLYRELARVGATRQRVDHTSSERVNALLFLVLLL